MSRHISRGNKPVNPLRNEIGSTTRVLLLLLLLVVAAAGYLFYFTDYINPRKEAAKPSVAQTAPTKQPLPPRPGQPGEVKPPEPAPVPASAPAPSPAPAPAPAPAQPGQPSAPVPVPPKPEQVKTAVAEAPATTAPAAKPTPAPAATKPAPSPAAAKPAPATAKPAPATAKPAPATAKPAPATAKPAPATAKPAAAKPAHKAAKPVAKKKGGAYRLLLGDFAPGKTFDAVQAKLKKSGITPVRKRIVQAAEPMHRLYVTEYADQDEAEAAVAKLKRLTADAFLIYNNGKYLLFGGSYLSPEKAASERKKLAAKGVTTAVRRAQVTVKVTRVTAGSYACSEDARKDAARLKKQGIKATVVKGK